MSEVCDVLIRGVGNVKGGRKVISTRLGCNDEVLRKQLSGAASHKLGAEEALAVARLLVDEGGYGCYDYAALVARECGGRFEIGDEELPVERQPMQRISDLMQETSHVTATFVEAMGDNKISDNELSVIEREIAEAEAVLMALRHAARSINAAGKPRTERDMVTLPVRSMRNEVPA